MKLKYLILATTLSLTASNIVNAQGQSQTAPTINLFPSTVIQDLKNSVRATNDMEKGMEPIIKQMDETMVLFKSANCDGEAGDSGCSQLKKQMQQQYLDLLTQMEGVLPSVEKSIKATNKSLAKSITTKIGKYKTPVQIQREILAGKKPLEEKLVAGKPGKLSTKFRKLLAIASSKGQSGSTVVTAASFFLETKQSLSLIEQTRAAIAQAKTQAALDLSLGTLSDEMINTVSSVKSILGDESGEVGIASDAPLIPSALESDTSFDESEDIY